MQHLTHRVESELTASCGLETGRSNWEGLGWGLKSPLKSVHPEEVALGKRRVREHRERDQSVGHPEAWERSPRATLASTQGMPSPTCEPFSW